MVKILENANWSQTMIVLTSMVHVFNCFCLVFMHKSNFLNLTKHSFRKTFSLANPKYQNLNLNSIEDFIDHFYIQKNMEIGISRKSVSFLRIIINANLNDSCILNLLYCFYSLYC